jgi:DNA-binding MarR family transcriptional regulator
MSAEKYYDDLWTAWAKMNSLYAKWTEANGINYYYINILYALDRHEKLTQKEICEMFGFFKTTVNGIVRKLAHDGYIEFEDDPTDGRAKKIRLTEAGHRLADEKLAPLYEAELKIIGEIHPEKMENMIGTLQTFNVLLEDSVNKLKRKQKGEKT